MSVQEDCGLRSGVPPFALGVLIRQNAMFSKRRRDTVLNAFESKDLGRRALGVEIERSHVL
jgi:hypothetical protein